MRLLAIGIAMTLMAVPAFADDYKIGVIHIERIMRDSAPAKSALARIEQEFKARDADIAAREQEVRTQTAQYDKEKSGLTDQQRAERERDLDMRTRDVQRLRQQFAEDLRARQFEELDKLKARLDQVLTQYAKDNHFDLILQDALFVGRAVDITDDVIKGLEK
jgi:outer membrane protein